MSDGRCWKVEFCRQDRLACHFAESSNYCKARSRDQLSKVCWDTIVFYRKRKHLPEAEGKNGGLLA
jgi:hypothetical protein